MSLLNVHVLGLCRSRPFHISCSNLLYCIILYYIVLFEKGATFLTHSPSLSLAMKDSSKFSNIPQLIILFPMRKYGEHKDQQSCSFLSQISSQHILRIFNLFISVGIKSHTFPCFEERRIELIT